MCFHCEVSCPNCFYVHPITSYRGYLEVDKVCPGCIDLWDIKPDSVKLTGDDIRKAVRELRANNAKPFSDGMYHVAVSPDAMADLMDDDLVRKIFQYGRSPLIDHLTIYGVKVAVDSSLEGDERRGSF